MFTSGGGATLNDATGEQTYFSREQGVYVMHSRIPEAGANPSGSPSTFGRLEM